MPRTTAAVGHRALSAATALVFGGGLALYQLTSLVIGPSGARQLHLSLRVPAVEGNDRAEPVASNVTVVLGGPAPVVGAPSPAERAATPQHRIAVTISPVPSPAPRRSDHPRPPVMPSPPPPGDDGAD